MDKDTGVASYMSARAQCSKYLAMLIMAQMITFCVFLLCYAFMQSEIISARAIGTLRMVVRGLNIVLSGVLCIANLLCVIKCIAMSRTYNDTFIGKEDSDVINEAFTVAKEVLHYRMVIALLITLCGITAWLIIRTVTGNSDMGEVISHAVMALAIGVSSYFLVPAVDRLLSYKGVSREGNSIRIAIDASMARSFAIGIPIMFAVYYQWRYFGNNRNLAWITFFAGLLLTGAVGMLMSICTKKNDI